MSGSLPSLSNELHSRINVQPCGMIAPHSHPRSSEIYINIAGPPLISGVIPENGAPSLFFLLLLTHGFHSSENRHPEYHPNWLGSYFPARLCTLHRQYGLRSRNFHRRIQC
jgi:hypothetical protein